MKSLLLCVSRTVSALAGDLALRGRSVASLRKVIRNGISTSGMPAFYLPEDELEDLAVLVHSLNSLAAEHAVPGDREAGEQFFFGKGQCSSCHVVSGRGKPVGPDLSNVAHELTVDELREALLDPSAQASWLCTTRPARGSLLLRNAGGDAWSELGHGFALCTRCGFAMSEEKPANEGTTPPPLPNYKKFRDHPSVFSTNPLTRCWPKSLPEPVVLRHKVLAARETTDVLILGWPGDSDEAPLFSLGRALVPAGARLLELDTRELNLELKVRDAGKLGIPLYDTIPGGAGYCFELFNLGRPCLVEARGILRGTPSHNASCRRACLECLLDFAGRFHADPLNRRAALDLLDGVLGGE